VSTVFGCPQRVTGHTVHDTPYLIRLLCVRINHFIKLPDFRKSGKMNETRIEIYPSKKYMYSGQIKLLEESSLSKHNKDLIMGFHNYLFSKGSSEKRVGKLVGQLRRLASHLQKDFDKATITDVQDLVAFFNRQERLSQATKSDYRRCLKQFYLYLEDKDDRLDSENREERLRWKKFYKYIRKEVKRGKETKEIDQSKLLTDNDISLVLEKGCRTQKERAFIKFLHESGARIGEALNLRIKDFDFSGSTVQVRLDGKTGQRTIPLVTSVPEIAKWLDIHPHKDNVQSPVWVGDNTKNKDKPIIRTGAVALIRKCFDRAGVNKTLNPHWFRHSRATLLARDLSEQVLCKYMGWTLGSKEVRTYCHMNNKQVTEAVLKSQGIKQAEEKQENKTVQCVCGSINDKSTSRYCFKCGKPLGVEVAIQDKKTVDDEINKTVQFMMEMSKNPELLQKFEEFKKQSGGV